jgi:NAD(P)-dependent dehydrogenase (short-subunit alcohol dehydrogenase family)
MPESSLPLEGKFAIVTGASRGIGLAIATRLAQDGAGIIITARGRESLDEAAAQIPGGKAIAVAGKSHDPAHQREVLETAHREFGAIDILVNNAGINPVYGPLMDIDLEAASKILDVNVLGTLGWTQALIGDERLGFRARGGSVVNISSVTGAVPSEGIGLYGISKAAVGHLTRTLAAELGPEIRVNSISPGVVKTQFARALYEGKEDDLVAAYPLKRLGVPEDVAAAAAFLAGPDSSWITGQDLTVDGGLTMAGGSA